MLPCDPTIHDLMRAYFHEIHIYVQEDQRFYKHTSYIVTRMQSDPEYIPSSEDAHAICDLFDHKISRIMGFMSSVNSHTYVALAWILKSCHEEALASSDITKERDVTWTIEDNLYVWILNCANTSLLRFLHTAATDFMLPFIFQGHYIRSRLVTEGWCSRKMSKNPRSIKLFFEFNNDNVMQSVRHKILMECVMDDPPIKKKTTSVSSSESEVQEENTSVIAARYCFTV